jgi:hypothetical protein
VQQAWLPRDEREPQREHRREGSEDGVTAHDD